MVRFVRFLGNIHPRSTIIDCYKHDGLRFTYAKFSEVPGDLDYRTEAYTFEDKNDRDACYERLLKVVRENVEEILDDGPVIEDELFGTVVLKGNSS